MFYNRKEELRILEDIYSKLKKRGMFHVVYGRRRVGKTELIKHFSSKHKSLYLFVEVKTEREILNDLEQSIEKILQIRPRFENWDNFFNFLFKEFKEKHIILIFDEFQNFNKINKGIFSKIQKYWDENKDKSKIFLIVIGSYIGLMKRLFMDKKEALFGRADYYTNLLPFNILQTSEFIKKTTNIKNIELIFNIYSITDGIPKYLLYLDLYKFNNIFELIDALFIDSPAPLNEEGKNILVLEFGSEHKGYFSILEAISRGKNIQNEIVHATGLNKDTVAKYIHELLNYYEIIKKEYPVTEKPSPKLSRYFLKDNFYKFWFRFIYKNKSLLESDKELLKDIIKKEYNSYMGYVFEDICIQLLKKLSFSFTKIGKWWYKDREIDIIALNKEKKEILFCECKWKNEKMKLNILKNLEEKAKLVNWFNSKRKEYFMLFSKNGFEKKLEEYAKNKNVKLFDLKDIEKVLNKSK